jgi:hypothetical protein
MGFDTQSKTKVFKKKMNLTTGLRLATPAHEVSFLSPHSIANSKVLTKRLLASPKPP